MKIISSWQKYFGVLGVAIVALGLIGCAGSENEPAAYVDSGTDAAVESEAAAPPRVASQSSMKAIGGGAAAPPASAIPRKIIYTADVVLVAEKLTPAQKKLTDLVRQHGGYLAETNIGGTSGEPRTGRWKVRVPVTKYQTFLDAVSSIGELESISSTSQDVSEEFYDIKARLRNKRVEEKRLIEHLNRSTAKLEDILKVEKEISRVRGEIEQMEGRLRVLSNLTELTTVTITIKEIKDYIPPTPPTFGTQISRSFQDSFSGVVDFGKNFVLVIVALAPWLVVLGIIIWPISLLVKRRWNNRGTAQIQNPKS